MADTITIGTITYHKLVTFKDCAAKTDLYGNEIPGAGGYLPWAFVNYDAITDFNECPAYGSYNPRYFTQKTSNNFISTKDLLDTPADINNTETNYKNITINSKTYYKLVCKEHLSYATDNTKSDKKVILKCRVKNYDAIVGDKHIRGGYSEYNIDDDSHNTLQLFDHEDPRKDEEYNATSHILKLPRFKNSKFEFYTYKTSGGNRGSFNVLCYNDVWTGNDVSNKYRIIRTESNMVSYGNNIYKSTSIYNNKNEIIKRTDGSNAYIPYALFWNICKKNQVLSITNVQLNTCIWYGVSYA